MSFSFQFKFEFQDETNWIIIDQIRTIDKSRITKIIGKLNQVTINELKNIIKKTFVD